MSFDKGISRTAGQYRASPPMYLVTLFEDFHGNREGFISLTKGDIWDHLVAHLTNWDVPYTIDELDMAIRKGYGEMNQHSKSSVRVRIVEIQPGQGFDLL